MQKCKARKKLFLQFLEACPYPFTQIFILILSWFYHLDRIWSNWVLSKLWMKSWKNWDKVENKQTFSIIYSGRFIHPNYFSQKILYLFQCITSWKWCSISKLIWPITVRINCSSNRKNISNSWLQPQIFKTFSWSLE